MCPSNNHNQLTHSNTTGSPHASAIPLETPRKLQSKTPFRKSPLTDPRFYPAPEPNHAPPAGTPRKQKTRHSSNPVQEPHIGWVIDSRDHVTESSSFNDRQALAAPSSFSTSLSSTPQSLPKFEHPSHALLKDNGFTQFVYSKYRLRCLKERRRLGSFIFIFLYIHFFSLTFILQALDRVKKWLPCSDFGLFFCVITLTAKCTMSFVVMPMKMHRTIFDTALNVSLDFTLMV